MEKRFYIYLHIKLDTGEPFYVGKGCNKRAYHKKRRNVIWDNVVNKHGYDIIFLEENLTEQDAFDLEKYWINRIGRKDLGKGPLVNLTDGGDGGLYNPSEETRKKFIKKGKDNPFYGKKHSEETRKKIKEARKKQVFSQETLEKFKNRVVSEETRKKMSEAHKGRTPRNKDKK